MRSARVATAADLPAALDELTVRCGRPVVVSVGGAGRMRAEDLQAVGALVRDHVLPVLEERGAAVVDGGTDAGVMRVMGVVRAEAGARFPLIGVAAEGTVRVPTAGDGAGSDDRAELEPNHTHVLLVPGTEWGDESAWIPDVAAAVAAGRPVVTLLVNGGPIAGDDALHSLRLNRPLVVVAGTGRLADAVAAATAGTPQEAPAGDIAASSLTRVVDVSQGPALAAALTELLT